MYPKERDHLSRNRKDGQVGWRNHWSKEREGPNFGQSLARNAFNHIHEDIRKK